MTKKILGLLLGLSVLFSCSTRNWTHADSVPQSQCENCGTPIPENTGQLIVVRTASWNATTGTLQRFEKQNGDWKEVGDSYNVVLGRTGLAWGRGLHDAWLRDPSHTGEPTKREGDGKSPAGVFMVTKAFGFNDSNETAKQIKLPYVLLKNSIECVDDGKSQYYNQIVDNQSVPQIDWNSSEKMRSIAVYKWGATIAHNESPILKNGGSCIFLHIWNGPQSNTAGCTAMEEDRLVSLLTWIDSAKNPVIAQLPVAQYESLKSRWKLP